MSNFWANALGLAQQSSEPAPPPAQQRPWFAMDAPMQQPVQQQPVYPQHSPQPVEAHHGWGTVEGSRARAKSAKSTETCHNCGSGNVFRPTPNSMSQCYDCGSNPRFEQSGGDGGLPSSESGPATPARQLATAGGGGASQFNPGVIVGRI